MSRLVSMFWILFFVSLILKVAAASLFPLSPDEAYYWVWSLHPQAGYFDHPGAISWIQWLVAHFVPAEWVPRVATTVLSQGSFVLWYFMARSFLSRERSLIFLGVILVNPLTGFGSVVSTPDAPLLFFYSLGLLGAIQRVQSKKRIWTLVTGLAIGLGFSAKYTAVLSLLPLLVLLIIHGRSMQMRIWEVVGFLGLLVAGAFPTLWWNAHNDFISFRFQLGHGFESQNWSWDSVVTYLLVVILLVGPMFLSRFPWLQPKARSVEKRTVSTLLWLSSLCPLLIFFYSSLKSFVEANWILPAFFPLWGLVLMQEGFLRRLRADLALWFLPQIFLIGAMIAGRHDLVPHKVVETYEFNRLLAETHDRQPLYLSNYQLASYFWYKTGTPFYKLKGSRRTDFFDFQENSMPASNSKVFYFLRARDDAFPDWFKEKLESLTLLRKLEGDRFELYEGRLR